MSQARFRAILPWSGRWYRTTERSQGEKSNAYPPGTKQRTGLSEASREMLQAAFGRLRFEAASPEMKDRAERPDRGEVNPLGSRPVRPTS